MLDTSDMHDYAVSALEDWLPGYTDALPDGRQYRIAATNVANVYVVTDPYGPEGPRWFEVTFTVREINQVGDSS